MDELNEAIQIFCRHLLYRQYALMMLSRLRSEIHRLVLLVKIIYISVQDLHE